MAQQPPARFDSFRKQAEQLIQSPARLNQLVGRGVRKLAQSSGAQYAELRRQLSLAIDLIRAWLDGDYRHISQKTIVVVVAALLYFVVPLDVIPDFLFGWGLVDDAAVLTYVFAQFKEEIDAFAAWREAQTGEGNTTPNDVNHEAQDVRGESDDTKP